MEIPEKNKVPVELIARFLNGEADTDDIIDLEQWKNASTENLRVFDEYRRIWEKTGQISLFADIDIENEWNVFLENADYESTSKPQKKKAFSPLLKIAAVVVLGLILGISGWYTYRNLRYETIVAENKVLELNMPDGSIVSLNKDSKLTYAKNFSKKRELVLDGEAFFEVNRDEDSPFLVKSGEVRVEVLGTSFNVIAYKEENIVQVFVESGKVAVFNANKDPVKKDFLQKGERIIYSRKTGVRSVQPNTELNYNAWRTGVVRFEASSLQYVTSTLESLYGMEIELLNPRLNNCRITVEFDNRSLHYILETITETLDLRLERTNKGYFIDGQGC